ncbi:MAG: GAF domain-containing protein, partial [Bacteroidota bacterium]
IALYAGMVEAGKEGAREVLRESIVLHEISLAVLKNGGIAPGMDTKTDLPPTSEELLPILRRAERLWERYRSQADIVMKALPDPVLGFSEQPEVLAAVEFLEKNAARQLTFNNELVKAYVAENQAKQGKLTVVLVGLLLLNAAVMALGIVLFQRRFIDRLTRLATRSKKLAEGEYSTEMVVERDPRMNAISQSVQQLSGIVGHSVKLSEYVSQGKYDYPIPAELRDHHLLSALKTMSQQIEVAAKEEQKSEWIANGLAQLGTLLYQDHGNWDVLIDKWLKAMIDYLGANQGGIFLKKEGEEPVMELKATYAWNRKKKSQKEIKPLEGLIGQTWVDKEPMLLTDIPDHYLHINSGLGQANPRSLTIQPLIYQDDVIGIVELATFQEWTDHELDFLKRASENLATALDSGLRHQQTQRLMEQYQTQNEKMRTQEEELRQNLEELSSTQETIVRKEQQYEARIATLEAELSSLRAASVPHPRMAAAGDTMIPLDQTG